MWKFLEYVFMFIIYILDLFCMFMKYIWDLLVRYNRYRTEVNRKYLGHTIASLGTGLLAMIFMMVTGLIQEPGMGKVVLTVVSFVTYVILFIVWKV